MYSAYKVHPDIKSHTDGCMSFLYGVLHCKSVKQKMNTKSSTRAKLVGVGYYLPYNIFICLFMGAEGYDIKQNIFFLDNYDAINMEKR